MNNAPTQHSGLAVRASDAEREQTVALLQHNFADGRLTQAELEERAGAAYAARTRAQLRDLTADLPAAEQQPPQPGMTVDLRLLIILLCVCPPAGMAYWLLSLRETALLRAWLMNARPWQRLLAGAIVAGAGVALEVLSHLAGAVRRLEPSGRSRAGERRSYRRPARDLRTAAPNVGYRAPRISGARLAAPGWRNSPGPIPQTVPVTGRLGTRDARRWPMSKRLRRIANRANAVWCVTSILRLRFVG